MAILLQGEEINGKNNHELELDVDNDLVSFKFDLYLERIERDQLEIFGFF